MFPFDLLKSALPAECFVAGSNDLVAEDKLRTYAIRIQKYAASIKARGRLAEGYQQAAAACRHYANRKFEKGDEMVAKAIESLKEHESPPAQAVG